jgi:4-amino-4-deoxy-L-arabinose transferase-like glycosyltransferase
MGFLKRNTELKQLSLFRRDNLWLAVVILAFPILLFAWRRSLHTIFFAITADDFHRTLYAWQVAEGKLVPSDLWPPLQFWVEALVLRVYPHILSVPYLVNLAASTGALVGLACLGRELGLGGAARLLTVALAATTPWFIWLSLSGLGEPLFIFCIVLAYFGVVRWRATDSELGLWIASLGLLAAGMVRFDGWGHSIAFSLAVVWLWWRDRRQNSIRSLIAAFLPWLFPISWLVSQYVQHGNPFWFSEVTREYWLAVHGALPLGTRLAWQPRDLWVVGGITIPIGLLGIWVARRRRGVFVLSLMWLGSFALLMLSTLNHTITQADPTRLVVIHALLLTPFVALLLQKASTQRKVVAAGIVVLVAALFVARLAILPTYPKGLPRDAEEVGRCINQLRAEQQIQPGEHIMIEVIFWDYVVLHVLSGDPGAVVYDRAPELVLKANGEHALDDIANPSVLASSADQLQTQLARQRVRLVIAYSATAISNLRPIARESLNAGRFHVFVLNW